MNSTIRKSSVRVVATTTGAAALALATVMSAHADVQAQPGDVVGVGSDTAQYGINFFADGDSNGGTGVNASPTNRVVSYDATGDANGRSTNQVNPGSTNINSTIVPRAGQFPTFRPNGTGQGIAALTTLDPSGTTYQFARASRLPDSGEFGTNSATTQGLHSYKFATDGLTIAVNNASTNAPATLSVAQLKTIYGCTGTGPNGQAKFTDVGGTSSDLINALLPQSGSGTRSQFLKDIGLTAPGACVNANVEENNPQAITGAANPADAIAPFSTGRIGLLNSGYFGSALVNTIRVNNAAPSASNYNDIRNIYVVVRQKDVASTKIFRPGGSQNFVNFLFAGPNGQLAQSGDLIASAGLTPSYADCGNNATSC